MSFEGPHSDPSQAASREFGQPRRRQNPWLVFTVVPVAGSSIIYAILASLNPLLSTSAVGAFCLSVLFLAALSVVLIHPNRDPLDPLRLAALVFLAIYCIAPLFTRRFEWFYTGDERFLLERSAIFVLVAFICLCVGYALGPSLRPSQPAADSTPIPQPAVAYFGLTLFAVGLLAYSVGIVSAGGLGRLFASEESRVQFFKGIGWLYWASLFMLPGGVLYFAASLSSRPRAAWLYARPLVTTFTALILLQGRFRALRALICLMILWHYRVPRFRAHELSVLLAGGFGFFVFVGYARHPDIRPYLLSDPLGVIAEVATNFLQYSQGIIGDTISRLPQVMLGLDAFPARFPHQWGDTVLVVFNPILRLFGLSHLQTENAGTVFFQLAHPEFPSWLETGYHTSLAGELLANFPWLVALPFFVLYGVLIRSLYAGFIGRENSLVYGSLYALLIFPVLSTLIVGVGLILFELAVVVSPLFVVRLLERRGPSLTNRASSPGSLPSGEVREVGTS